MAHKTRTEEKIREGLQQLRQAGIDLEDFSASLIPRLKQDLGKGQETDLAISFLLGKIADPAAALVLGEIEESAANKELRKEARRSLFKLSQRGLAIPREAQQRPAVAGPLFSDGPIIEAYMSPPDGGGGYLVWIAKPQPNHGLQLIQGMLHSREGLLRIAGAQVRRKELRRMAREIQTQHGATMIAIPWEYADRALYEAYETAKARGQTGLENFYELRSVVATGKPKQLPHPIYDQLNAAEAREGAWREASRRLLDEPELRYWVLTEPWLGAFLTQIQEAQTSRLVLNPAQKEERVAAIVRDAVKELCRGANGKAFQRRMEDTALYFLETGRVVQAKLAFAVALQISEGDPGPLDVAFLTGLVQKSFALLLSQEKAQKAEEPSLIIKP
ncbi:MAG TPA: hypothetical protein VHM64_05040 [Candidatus Binatia bacterium]|nr:hypothetical protein [Candidatus Binatia bacterium]